MGSLLRTRIIATRHRRRKRNAPGFAGVVQRFSAWRDGSEAKLAVGGLAAALALRQRGFLGGEVDRRAGEHFVDVAAHDAAAVGAVPIALDNHRAAALGA